MLYFTIDRRELSILDARISSRITSIHSACKRIIETHNLDGVVGTAAYRAMWNCCDYIVFSSEYKDKCYNTGSNIYMEKVIRPLGYKLGYLDKKEEQ